MDLKIVYLLFACALSIALVQGEEEPGDEGPGEEGPGEEGPEGCNCKRGGRRWGRHHGGGKFGNNKDDIFKSPFKLCDEINKKMFQGKCRFSIISFYTKFYAFL